MSEEEIIKIIKEKIILDFACHNPIDKIEFEAIQGLLDLYKKEKERNALLLIVNAGYFDLEKYIKNNYISRSKINEKLNYFENSFDYDDDGTSYELVIKVLDELLEEN